ncbi:zinc dependent phospholipase C family protein [Haliovirga abyssi]|uniref:Phospholipase C/D domain-containing protein n=1 Tax=Haliovirga abyssi TaxID=2996794 RepID=A0AAU9D9M8_9FUSO|nr:zinc dependent phospholipase C family protein [Haliovirga abyssi]BDU50005.1 hypothetical protein HLVA_05740 [Haliovirga abyssi]
MRRLILSVLFFDKFLKFWGPGIHLHLGNKLLNSDKDFEGKDIIKNYKKEFLYGNIAPDITLGKKYIKDLEKHSHSWNVGFEILNKANSDKNKALAYGYLSHLASDIIAHNFFIPKNLLVSKGMRSFSHMILEIKSDMMLYKDTYELVYKMSKVNLKDEDLFLKSVISESFLPFKANRKIFEYSLKAMKSKYMYSGIRIFTNYENWIQENKKILEKYHKISYNLIENILEKKERSILLKYDPNGEKNIGILNELKKEYKLFKMKDYETNIFNIPEELRGI